MAAATSLVERVQPLLKHFQQRVIETFGTRRVISIFKIGSLGSHGGFSLCSDVDVALMLDEIRDSDYKAVQTVWDEIKASDFEFADRLSVFWSSYTDEIFNKGQGRFPPLDRLDFLRYAVLLYGTDHRDRLSAPTHEDLVIESAKFILEHLLSGGKLEKLVGNLV